MPLANDVSPLSVQIVENLQIKELTKIIAENSKNKDMVVEYKLKVLKRNQTPTLPTINEGDNETEVSVSGVDRTSKVSFNTGVGEVSAVEPTN